MDQPIKTYGAIGLLLVGAMLLAGSLTFDSLPETAFVAFLGFSSLAFGTQVLRKTRDVWWV